MDTLARLRTLTKPQLLKLCKENGFKRYSTLDKFDLIRLLIIGSHKPPYIRPPWKSLHSSRGPEVFEWDKHTITINPHENGGYLIGGINLEGKFDSHFIEDTQVRSAHRYRIGRYDTDDEYMSSDSSDGEHEYTYTTKPGGWWIPAREYDNFLAYKSSLIPPKQPPSLLELAGRVINSRYLWFWKQQTYIPPQMERQLKKLDKN